MLTTAFNKTSLGSFRCGYFDYPHTMRKFGTALYHIVYMIMAINFSAKSAGGHKVEQTTEVQTMR